MMEKMTDVPRRSIRIFYTGSFLSSLINGIIGPLFIVYLLGTGFEPVAIGTLLLIQRCAIVLFELPTGLWADGHGQRKSVLISYATMIFVSFVWFASTSFVVLVVTSIIWGIAYTFQSGAKESLMIQALNISNDDGRRTYIYSRMSMWGNAGLVLGGLTAAVIASLQVGYIWLVAGVLYGVLWLLYTQIPNDQSFKKDEDANANKRITPTALLSITREVWSNRNLRIVTMAAIIFSFATSMYGFVYPVLLKRLHEFPDSSFGVLGSMSALVGIAVMAWGAHTALKRSSKFVLIFYGICLTILLFFFAQIGSFIWIICLYTGIELILQAWYPIAQSFMNSFIESHNRSSVLSYVSLYSLISIALAEWFSGAALMSLSPTYVVLLSATGVIVVVGLLLLINQRKAAP